MSAALRQAGRAATRAVQSSHLSTQLQQRRFAGDLPVHNNKFIEQWGTFREHIPMSHSFKFDGQHLQRILIWAVAFPLAVFNMVKAEVDTTDDLYDRKKKEFM